MYVVQYRFKSSDAWSCCPGRYETIEAAAEVLKTKFPASCYRIAEVYIVERYKAVRYPLEVSICLSAQ